ncbi:MAG: hypothetical protein Q8R69_25770 [Telluria sp.]|nr:hypothetical protein [Telluria sp.]
MTPAQPELAPQAPGPAIAPAAAGAGSIALRAALLLGASFVAFILSDPWFAILEDETTIVALARASVRETLTAFWFGEGRHMHPPLSDLFLHAWLELGGGSSRLAMRLPSVVLFLAGLVVLGLAARRIAGNRALLITLVLGVLWPYGFHFGRLAGWYSWCFFLVAALTWSYLGCAQRLQPRRVVLFAGCALLLVYSNYLGWAALGCLALDAALVRRDWALTRVVAATASVLALTYLPMWHLIAEGVERAAGSDHGSNHTARALNILFNFYTAFVSESIAPWTWQLSAPAFVAIVGAIGIAAWTLARGQRAFLGYFALLFMALASIDALNTKRLLVMAPWLLLPLALAGAQPRTTRSARALAACLALLAAIGWVGIFSRNHYAAQHFVEPWDELAQEAAQVIRAGGVVVGNSPSFAFELNYALARTGDVPASAVPGWVKHPRYLHVVNWSPAAVRGRGPVHFVSGVPHSVEAETTIAREWLQANCALLDERRLVRDPGYELKARYFPRAVQPLFRVVVRQYDCTRAQAA